MKRYATIIFLTALATALFLLPTLAFAQDDTTVVAAAATTTGINWLADNYQWLLVTVVPVLWELVARIWPTTKDSSLINLVKRLIDFIVPNNKKGGGKL